VFTARYALSPYIKQIRFVFKGIMADRLMVFGRTFVVYFLHPTKNISTELKMQLCSVLEVLVPLQLKGLKEVIQRERRKVRYIFHNFKTFKLSE
jgi:hypothetical protein